MSPGRWKRPKSMSAPPKTIIKTPTTSSRRPASATSLLCAFLEESGLVGSRVRKGNAHVVVRELGGDAAPGGPGEEADLDQVRLVHVPASPGVPPNLRL